MTYCESVQYRGSHIHNPILIHYEKVKKSLNSSVGIVTRRWHGQSGDFLVFSVRFGFETHPDLC
jgi:hypothetical protein